MLNLKNTHTTKKILLVEDNINLIHVVGLTLELHGYEVIRTTDGKQALNLAASQLPDLIMLDLSLPDLYGFAASGLIRRNPTTHSIPILAATERKSFKEKEECLQSGCDAYIYKPFTPKELVSRIEKLLV